MECVWDIERGLKPRRDRQRSLTCQFHKQRVGRRRLNRRDGDFFDPDGLKYLPHKAPSLSRRRTAQQRIHIAEQCDRALDVEELCRWQWQARELALQLAAPLQILPTIHMPKLVHILQSL